MPLWQHLQHTSENDNHHGFALTETDHDIDDELEAAYEEHGYSVKDY